MDDTDIAFYNHNYSRLHDRRYYKNIPVRAGQPKTDNGRVVHAVSHTSVPYLHFKLGGG